MDEPETLYLKPYQILLNCFENCFAKWLYQFIISLAVCPPLSLQAYQHLVVSKSKKLYQYFGSKNLSTPDYNGMKRFFFFIGQLFCEYIFICFVYFCLVICLFLIDFQTLLNLGMNILLYTNCKYLLLHDWSLNFGYAIFGEPILVIIRKQLSIFLFIGCYSIYFLSVLFRKLFLIVRS